MSAETLRHRRVFVDTNVLLYALDTTAGAKRARAAALMGSIWDLGNGCVSVQILQEFYVNATRKLRHPTSHEMARRVVSALSRWQVHSPTADDVLSAIDLQRAARLSFWDAMVMTSAGRLGCAVLYSEDLNPGQIIGGVQVVNPF